MIIPHSQSELKKLFDYDEITGELTWLVNRGSNKLIGKKAGCIKVSGRGYVYTAVKIDNVEYKASYIVWKWLYGTDVALIDHKNRDSTDNSKNNLRESNEFQNASNLSLRNNNKTGIKGLSVSTSRGKKYWLARVGSEGVYYRKTFAYNDEGKEKAVAWLNAERARLHGEFGTRG